MRNFRISCLVLLLGALAAGCGRSGNDTDAIRNAINSHLAARGNLNVAAFDTEVQKVDVKGDQATADVAFHVKGGPGVMQLTYNLKKTGGAWAVVDSNPVGTNFAHPSLDANGNAAPGATPGAPSTDIIDSMRQKMATPAK
jgi:hypothetical protein